MLAGDPAWVEQSISSYYGLVRRIVVSYDRSHNSWSGDPLSVREALRRIRAADPDKKVIMLPGDHADSSKPALTNETHQRRVALDAASEGADWVLQLDTDEIMPSPAVFARHLRIAEDRGAEAVDYPSRLMYARSHTGVFLEMCGRFWTTQSAYPGPLAVRAGTELTHARQAATTPTYRVDVAAWNTDPVASWTKPVHAVIRVQDAVIHMSWVRTHTQMAEKSRVSGHASAHDWRREIAAWKWRSRHPYLAAAAAPLTRAPTSRFKVVRLPAYAFTSP